MPPLEIHFCGPPRGDPHISWEEWFEKFDESDRAFLYRERKASGEDSTFFKLVSRENA